MEAPILSLFWSMMMFFLFVIWIWVLISIFADIFRNKDMNGGVKAIWILFVVFLPWLGVLVYIIANGGEMNERSMQAAAANERAARDYIKDAAGSGGSADELAKLADLRDKGVLTGDEFAAQKAKLLA
ncbi:MAG: SHOCT domain-containing protein [Actinomycetota bacterium]|nr:SHOCT domain-containing protein [Actinomycetota bacterium]